METEQNNPQNENTEYQIPETTPPSPPTDSVYNYNVTDSEARAIITKSLSEFKTKNWAKIFTQPISKLKSEASVGQPVKILARIKSISDPYPININEQRITIVDLVLADRDNNDIGCLPIPFSKNGDKILRIFERHKFAIFVGTIISIIDTKKSGYKFLIIDVDEKVTAEDLIYVRDYLTTDPTLTDLIARLQYEGKIFDYIKDTLVREMGIKGLDSAIQMDKAIDFMIYQAFSFGKDGNASMRLHSLVIGAPGSGKKILTNIAMAINPVSQEASSGGEKITSAGMIGNVVTKGNKKISEPGYFSLASGGTLCIQDFHGIKKNRDAIVDSFASVMEDGQATDSTSARTVHTAETSIHLDTNKFSQLRKSDTENSLSDIDIPTNVITRFDFIVDIEADAKRQTKVMMAMTNRATTLASFTQKVEDIPQLRQLKRLIAYLITYTPEVKITEEIAAYKTDQLLKLISDYDSKIKDIDSWQGQFTRLANSINKYLKAIATSRFTNKVTTADVDLAISFIKPKLDYISSLTDSRTSRTAANSSRKDLICNHFNGTVNINDIHTHLKENGFTVSLKTVERDLKELAKDGKVKKDKHAYWEFLFT